MLKSVKASEFFQKIIYYVVTGLIPYSLALGCNGDEIYAVQPDVGQIYIHSHSMAGVDAEMLLINGQGNYLGTLKIDKRAREFRYWFSFKPEEEYKGSTYTIVSDPRDGSCTLSLQKGDYKVKVNIPSHESFVTRGTRTVPTEFNLDDGLVQSLYERWDGANAYELRKKGEGWGSNWEIGKVYWVFDGSEYQLEGIIGGSPASRDIKPIREILGPNDEFEINDDGSATLSLYESPDNDALYKDAQALGKLTKFNIPAPKGFETLPVDHVFPQEYDYPNSIDKHYYYNLAVGQETSEIVAASRDGNSWKWSVVSRRGYGNKEKIHPPRKRTRASGHWTNWIPGWMARLHYRWILG